MLGALPFKHPEYAVQSHQPSPLSPASPLRFRVTHRVSSKADLLTHPRCSRLHIFTLLLSILSANSPHCARADGPNGGRFIAASGAPDTINDHNDKNRPAGVGIGTGAAAAKSLAAFVLRERGRRASGLNSGKAEEQFKQSLYVLAS